MSCDNNKNNKGCGCHNNPSPELPEVADMSMNVCDRNTNMLPMLQTYTTKVLKPNVHCKKNILTRQMMNCEGCKYVIKWDFDLNGKTIVVPENCILEFDGGSLKNGTIIGQDTVFINVGDVDIWGENLTMEGTWREHSGGGGGEPSEYIKRASVSTDGNTLTLTKKDETTVTFTPDTQKDVDDHLDATSVNPVQNKVVTEAIDSIKKEFEYIKESMLTKGTKDYTSAKTFFDENGVQTNNIYYVGGLESVKVKQTADINKVLMVYANFFDKDRKFISRTAYESIDVGTDVVFNIPSESVNGYCGITFVEYSSSSKYRRFKLNVDDITAAGIMTNVITNSRAAYNINTFSTEITDIQTSQKDTYLPDFSYNPATLVAFSNQTIGGAKENAKWYTNYDQGYSCGVIDLMFFKKKGYDTITITGKEEVVGEGIGDGKIAVRFSLLRSLPNIGETSVPVDFAGLGTTLCVLANASITIPIPANANYIAFMLCNSLRDYLPKSITFKSSVYGRLNSESMRVNNCEANNIGNALKTDGYVQKEITIGTWNVGHYAMGTNYYPDIPAEDVDSKYNAFKSIINGMDCNIMGVNEFSVYFGKNDNNVIRYGEGLLTKFRKNYHYEQNLYADNVVASNINIESVKKSYFSNMPASINYNDKYDRLCNDFYILCKTYINNHVVYLIFTHLTWSGGVDGEGNLLQTAQIQQLVNLGNSLGNVAIIGDFNADDSDNVNNLTLFKDNGYSIAHTIPTCGTRSYDNIVYKGSIVVDNIKIYNTDLSDHKPVTARIRTTDYTPIDNNKQNIIAFGDSIIRGYRNGGKSFLSYIGKPYGYANYSESAATIAKDVVKSQSEETVYYPSVITQIENIGEINYNPDVVIIGTGICDYFFDSPMGAMANSVVTSSIDYPEESKKTIIGALEYIFCKIIERWPYAKRIFVTSHKMKYNIQAGDEKIDAATTKNNAGYTATDMFDHIHEICKRYNVAYISIFSESQLNTNFEQYVSSTHIDNNTSPADLALFNANDYCDKDGIHPSDLGYRIMYAPLISNYIK